MLVEVRTANKDLANRDSGEQGPASRDPANKDLANKDVANKDSSELELANRDWDSGEQRLHPLLRRFNLGAVLEASGSTKALSEQLQTL